VDVGRPPGVVVVAPGIGAGLDGDELVVAVGIRDAAAGAGEVGIERRGMLVDDVDVAARRIALPDLDEGMRYGTAGLVEQAALDDDALAERLAGVLGGEVGLLRLDVGMAVDRGR
jgi:hypothetical protein